MQLAISIFSFLIFQSCTATDNITHKIQNDANFNTSVADFQKTSDNISTNVLSPRFKSAFLKAAEFYMRQKFVSKYHNASSMSNNSDILKYLKPPTAIKNDKIRSGARQFVFHPYLPYNKEMLPDEKISIQDVLPIKMAKFIKSMVEDAPWEQMFMKMVRMVVDQFVDKIIEKMFSHDDEKDKFRSLDADSFLENISADRSRRSTINKNSKKQDEWIEGEFSPNNRLYKDDVKKVKQDQEKSWLDIVLDSLFPDDSEADFWEEELKKLRKKRHASDTFKEDTQKVKQEDITRKFLIKYIELKTGNKASESFREKLKSIILEKLAKSVSKLLFESTMTTNDLTKSTTTAMATDVESLSNLISQKRNKHSHLWKRSIIENSIDDDEDSSRLWQEVNRKHRPLKKHASDDCSLRRACNTGRLLSRLPSVKNISLQLKSTGKEPHWDALVWGMSKKKCSRIFCKRQRLPKGSTYRWDSQKRFINHDKTFDYKFLL